MLVSILTVTLNASKHFQGLADSIRSQRSSSHDLVNQVEWVVVDGASKDGTVEMICANSDVVDQWTSEPDGGFYDALNKALKLARGEYYIVMGADDRFVEGALDVLIRELHATPDRDMYMFSVLRGKKVLRSSEPTRWRKTLGWSQFNSSHSVGTVIRRALHDTVGLYSTRYPLLADGHFLRRAVDSGASVHISDLVLGEFADGGMTSNDDIRIIAETWMIQSHLGEKVIPQTLLLLVRVARMMAKR